MLHITSYNNQYHNTHTRAIQRRNIVISMLFITLGCFGFKLYGDHTRDLLSPLPSYAIENQRVYVDTAVDLKPTQKQQILSYIIEKFGDRSADLITIINQCENHSFAPDTVHTNKNGSCDVGVTQENTPCHGAEFERLKDFKYNIDEAYRKYHAAGNTFKPWTCSHVIGEKNYLDK